MDLLDRALQLTDFSPLGRRDCGSLCRKRCCQGGPEEGIFLLPGEERYYQKETWATLRRLPDPLTGLTSTLLVCFGKCRRELRPLACRTFPLVPVLAAGGRLELRLDGRGILICPLVQTGDLQVLHPAFLRRVKRAWRLLLRDPAVFTLVERASCRREMTEPWEKLLR